MDRYKTNREGKKERERDSKGVMGIKGIVYNY